MGEPDILYHYCSLETFYNIIKNKTLRLFDATKSNDALELITYRDNLYLTLLRKKTELLEKLISQEENLTEKHDSAYIQDCTDRFSKLDVDNLLFKTKIQEYLRVWVICFSEKGDLLSQWRGYADDAKGISIGIKKDFIDKQLLISENPIISCRLKKIAYTDADIENTVELNAKISKVDLDSSVAEIETMVAKAICTIFRESPFFKKSSFSEEKEWRLAITDSFATEMPRQAYLDILKAANEELATVEIIDYNFVLKNEKIVSYIELYLSQIHDAIAEIIIGPKSNCSVEDIRSYLIFHGLLKDENDDSIRIKKSESSYR